MASEKGPLLSQRLAPVFTAVDSCIQRLGDFYAILDREFAFVSEASPNEQAEVDRLGTYSRQWLYLNTEDAKIASLALVRFGSEVEESASPLQNKNLRRDDGLAARMILLAEYIRAKRLAYDRAGGLSR
jgi:hypothetical protein